MKLLPPSTRIPSGNGNKSGRADTIGSTARGCDISCTNGTKTKKRAAGVGDVHPVRVKRERIDTDKVMAEDESRAKSEPETVVKTEDMEVVPCKEEEPTEAAGAFKVDSGIVLFR